MRRLIRWTALAVVLGVAGLSTAAAVVWARADVSTVGTLDFENRLRIPPLEEGRQDVDGRRVFDLRLRTGRTELRPGTTAETWGVNGPYMGPTLRASRGERVVVRARNDLPEDTTLHWHGMHLPARADGGPHTVIARGSTWTPSWTVDQPAATLWYHPHPHGRTEEHVSRGVVGMFILDDDAPSGRALPHRYGVDDVPVILQDVRLEDGRLDRGNGLVSPTGRLGSTILVNGTYDPHLRVSTERVRLRLLNASTARVYDVGLADGRRLDLVAVDGGLLPRPHRAERVTLSPGERAEVVVTMRPGERAVLRSFAPDLGMSFWEERFAGGDDAFDLLELRAAPRLAPSAPVPSRLAAPSGASAADAVRERRFELQGQGSINGRAMDPARLDEVVPAGETELWEVENAAGIAHNFHVHGTSFLVLGEDGRPLTGPPGGPQDTVFVRPGQTRRLLVRFEHPDPTTPQMYHCHLLQHEDRGMMGQALVLRPGEASAFTAAAGIGHDDHGG